MVKYMIEAIYLRRNAQPMSHVSCETFPPIVKRTLFYIIYIYILFCGVDVFQLCLYMLSQIYFHFYLLLILIVATCILLTLMLAANKISWSVSHQEIDHQRDGVCKATTGQLGTTVSSRASFVGELDDEQCNCWGLLLHEFPSLFANNPD